MGSFVVRWVIFLIPAGVGHNFVLRSRWFPCFLFGFVHLSDQMDVFSGDVLHNLLAHLVYSSPELSWFLWWVPLELAFLFLYL